MRYLPGSSLRGDRVLVHVLAFDADQDSLSGVAPDGVEALVRGGQLDAEASMIRRGPLLWAFYDRDGDGRLETGLRTAVGSSVVTSVVPGEGAPSAEALIGTTIARADWMGEHAQGFERMLHSHVPATWIVSDPALAGLPEPMAQHEHPAVRASYDQHGFENAVVSLESRGFNTTAIDVDRSSFRGRGRRHLADGIEAAVREGHFSAEFALSSMPAAAWAWYDTDLDGAWDVVLVRVVDEGQTRRNAFRRGEDGRLQRDEALVEGLLIRPSLFGRRHQRRFRQVVSDLFSPSELEAE